MKIFWLVAMLAWIVGSGIAGGYAYAHFGLIAWFAFLPVAGAGAWVISTQLDRVSGGR